MKILLFGATGRVGAAVMAKALAKGYAVTAFVRNPKKLTLQHNYLTTVTGDVYDSDALSKLAAIDFDVVINVIGADPLKPSTLFRDTTQVIIDLMNRKGGARYLAITGIAQMEKTFWGKLTIGILKLTPVKHAIADHQQAYDQIRHTQLKWTLIGCPYIKDGPELGVFRRDIKFRGGFKTIHPGDVANALIAELELSDYQKIVGVWY